MRDLTPAHMRCGPRNCPSVRETDDGKSLLIVGRIAVSHEMAGSDINRGDDEEAVIISKDLLSGYVAEHVREAIERCAKIADAYFNDGDWDKDACEAIARNIRDLLQPAPGGTS